MHGIICQADVVFYGSCLRDSVMETDDQQYDVFLSHAHEQAAIVEQLAARLEDEHRLRPWLDKWILVPGELWQPEMAHGLDQAKCCAVFYGDSTPDGWFRQEIQRALNRQAENPSFRVIPVLLPGSREDVVNEFVELRTWVNYRNGLEDNYAFHLLVCGIRGVSPGRYQEPEPDNDPVEENRAWVRKQLEILNGVKDLLDQDHYRTRVDLLLDQAMER